MVILACLRVVTLTLCFFIDDKDRVFRIFKHVATLVGKCRSITFSRCNSPIEHVYRIGGHELELVDQIKDLEVFLNRKMTFLAHIETIISKSARMLGFIKRLSKEFRDPKGGRIGSISNLKPKGFGFEFRIRQGYLC
jgi:hypothetical protein